MGHRSRENKTPGFGRGRLEEGGGGLRESRGTVAICDVGVDIVIREDTTHT